MNCVPVLYLKRFVWGKKTPRNGRNLDSDKLFDFQVFTYSLLFSFFTTKVLNVGM